MSTHKHAARAAARAMSTTPARATEQHTIRKPRIKFTLEASTPEKVGFDPYNTSGSFDRRKNWERVGKR